MSEPLAYLHGRLLPASQANLSLHDSGFVMGATVTDLCRTVHHRLYRWDDHLARFRHSCAAAQLVPPLGDGELTRIANDLVAHNAGQPVFDDGSSGPSEDVADEENAHGMLRRTRANLRW